MAYIRFLALAFSVATVSILAQPVEAGHGSWGGGSSGGGYGSGGSSGGSWGGSSGGSSGGSWGGSSGRVGPLRRIAARIHARKVAWRNRGSSGGSYGGSSGGQAYTSSWGGSSGSGSSGGSNAYYGSGYSSYSAPANHGIVSSVAYGATAPYESAINSPSYGSSNSIVHESSIVQQPTIESPRYEQPLNNTVAPSSDAIRRQSAKPAMESDAAMLTVTVPDDATVTVNERPTTSDGNVRQFMSQGLKKGFVYTYVVKVSYDANGEQKTDSQEVKLRAGETKEVDFGSAEEASDEDVSKETDDTALTPVPYNDVVTVVRLHVPADAQVTLAGNPTKGNGIIRTFRTKQLKAGEQWKDYTVRVVATVNGQSITRERTIDVASGSTNELSFDFDTTNSIARR